MKYPVHAGGSSLLAIAGKAVVLFLLISLDLLSYGQQHRFILDSQKSAASVLENDSRHSRFYFSFDALTALEVSTEAGLFTELVLDGGHYTGELGAPKLPAVNRLIEVPFGAEVSVDIKGYTSQEIRLPDHGFTHPLMPVQPSLLKKQEDTPAPFFFLDQAYDKSAYTGEPVARIEILGVLRGVRLARLSLSPVSYHPGNHSIMVHNHIELEVSYSGADPALAAYKKASTHSPAFDVVYNRILNPSTAEETLKAFPDLTQGLVKMLVISHPDFQETLRPFIEWQTQKGFKVVEAYTNVIGNTPAAIKGFIQSQYQQSRPEDVAPTYLVLVGDILKLPASGIGTSSKEVTDLYYASVDGDFLPDMYYGRLSARNASELKNQIDKIIYYQQYAFEDPAFLDEVTLIAGEDSFWNHQILQPTVKYATQNYYNAVNGFSRVNAFLNNYTGSYNLQSMAVSMVNYTGHCLPTEWYDPRLTSTGVYQMNNTGRYPLVIGNCCKSGLFGSTESIGEAWVRARDKGAVAYIGSAPDTHWFEDFYWSVGAFPIIGNNAGYVPTVTETSTGAYDAPFVTEHTPVGALQFVGNLAITQANIRGYPTHSNLIWYWEGYHTFGDPSTVIYHTQGKENNVIHFPVIPLGDDEFSIEALPGSYVGLTKSGELIAAGYVGESGSITLPIQAITQEGTARIVITKAQYIPYIKDIQVASLQGAYVVLNHLNINDTGGNNNHRADYSETIALDISIKNIGTNTSGPLSVSISGGDNYLSILNPDQAFGFPPLPAAEGSNTDDTTNVFRIKVSDQVPNEHIASFLMNISDGVRSWQSGFMITAYAPRFLINPIHNINDSSSGNSNGRLDPGEAGSIAFQITNAGGAGANNPIISLLETSPYLSVIDSPREFSYLEAGNSMNAAFDVKAENDAPNGTIVPLTLSVTDGTTARLQTSLIIGFIPEITIGSDNTPSNQYPFYNLYKANRTQMIYDADEIGPGEKIITSIGFDIQQVSSVYNQFPNFKILIKHTGNNQFSNAFHDMSDAVVAFSSPVYNMPGQPGWHSWSVEPFVYDGFSNIIIEVVWGSLPGWTTNFFKVASSAYSLNRVAYGYSDAVPVAPFNGVSFLRPNLLLNFTSIPVPIPQTVSFSVKNDNGYPLDGVIVQVGTQVRTTRQDGIVAFELLPGEYSYSLRENGSTPFQVGTFSVEDSPVSFEFTHIRTFGVEFIINDEQSQSITDASISLNGMQYEPGDYSFPDLRTGQYGYVVSREGYFDYPGELMIVNRNIIVEVKMVTDDTGILPVEDSPKFMIYPVPARTRVNIDVMHYSGPYTISLLGPQGNVIDQLVVEQPYPSGSLGFDIEQFSAGLYYIKLQHGGQTVIQKLIVY